MRTQTLQLFSTSPSYGRSAAGYSAKTASTAFNTSTARSKNNLSSLSTFLLKSFTTSLTMSNMTRSVFTSNPSWSMRCGICVLTSCHRFLSSTRCCRLLGCDRLLTNVGGGSCSSGAMHARGMESYGEFAIVRHQHLTYYRPSRNRTRAFRRRCHRVLRTGVYHKDTCSYSCGHMIS